MSKYSVQLKLAQRLKQIITAAVILLGILCVAGTIYFFSIGNPLFMGTKITEEDFATNAERLNFLNEALPIKLPNDMTITRLYVIGWQDWIFEVEGKIPQNKIDSFIQSLPLLDQPAPDTFEGDIAEDHIDIKIDRATGTIGIDFVDI